MMNIVFWFLVVVIAILSWFAISFIFIGLGRRIKKKLDEISNIITYEENEKEEDKNE